MFTNHDSGDVKAILSNFDTSVYIYIPLLCVSIHKPWLSEGTEGNTGNLQMKAGVTGDSVGNTSFLFCKDSINVFKA